MAEALAYLYSRLPILLLFGGGYVLYRLMAVTGLAEVLVGTALARARGRVPVILAVVLASAGALSLLVSNTITVLALLPALKQLDQDARRAGCALTTALTLAAIYGANIGGMGSLIGSPANMLLLGALDYFQVPGADRVTFASWLLWALPLVVLLLAAAFAVVMLGAVPRSARTLRLPAVGRRSLDRPQRRALAAVGVFVLFWTLEAVAREAWPGYAPLAPVACALFSAGWLARIMASPPALLRFRDLLTELPRRGLLFLLLLASVLAVVRVFDLDRLAAQAVARLVEGEASVWLVYLLLTLSVILLTEVFSNTVVSTAFFAVAFAAAQAQGLNPLALMVAVSAASTCAFMTPVATPVNALAYGEMRGTSLARMLLLGLAMNLAAVLLMTVWISRAIPLVYGAH
ncbi:MAG: SLC13 family permease [Desulfovibrionaceae bacterium]